MTKATKAARFAKITEADGYKFVPANKAAEKFCVAYGCAKFTASEAMTLIGYDQIEWGK
jgi:hypothetical protein